MVAGHSDRARKVTRRPMIPNARSQGARASRKAAGRARFVAKESLPSGEASALLLTRRRCDRRGKGVTGVLDMLLAQPCSHRYRPCTLRHR
jgi:hypothetical protein